MGANIGSNGKIQIQGGEGLSQAILREAGVKGQEVSKIKSSDWNSIFKEVNKQQAQANNGQEGVKSLYNGGNDLGGPSNQNYVIYKNATLEFTQEIWTNILNIINNALGRTEENKLVYDANNTTNDINETTSDTNKNIKTTKTSKTVTQTVDTKQAQKDAEAVKITVPKPEIIKQSEEYSTKAKKMAENLKKELKSNWVNQSVVKKQLEELKDKPELAAMLVKAYGEGFAQDIDDVFGMGFGFDKSDFYNWVLSPLIEKAKNLGIDTKGINENSDIKDMDKMARTLADKILEDFNTKVNKAQKEHKNVQNTFDEANKFLSEVANMKEKPEIEISENEKYKTAKLSDGRYIRVHYDTNGEIDEISISHDTTPAKDFDNVKLDLSEVTYKKDNAKCTNDERYLGHYYKITQNYDFDKLKALAEKIFGKWETTD